MEFIILGLDRSSLVPTTVQHLLSYKILQYSIDAHVARLKVVLIPDVEVLWIVKRWNHFNIFFFKFIFQSSFCETKFELSGIEISCFIKFVTHSEQFIYILCSICLSDLQ